MLRKILMVVMLSLVVFPASASAAPGLVDPTSCASATVTQDGATTYFVAVTGYMRSSRLVEYPVAEPAVVVAGPSLFGDWVQTFEFAGVTLDPRQYQVQVSGNGETWVTSDACIVSPAPLGVIVEDFRASCVQNTVMLEWSVASHIDVTHFVVAKDGDEVLTVQATCPGCTSGASYMRYVFLGDPTGIYTLVVWNGDTISDISEFWLASCQVPTAVRLGGFSAR